MRKQSIPGLPSFRGWPGVEAILPVAHGKDAFVHMPTGRGKSLCMFLLPLSLSNTAMGIITSNMQGLVWGEPELPEDVFSFC